MKQHRYILLMVLLSLLLLLIVGTASALTQRQQSNEDILRQVVLRKTDFPGDVEQLTFSSDESKSEDFNEQISFVTIPFWAEGFVDAYRVNGWYSQTFEDSAFQEFNQGAFVENIAYLFQNREQAVKAFEQQINQFDNERPTRDNTTIKDVQFDNLQGKFIQIDYTDEGIGFTVYYLVSVVDNQLIFLMVDGVPDPTVEKTFEQLVTKLVSYQSTE